MLIVMLNEMKSARTNLAGLSNRI